MPITIEVTKAPRGKLSHGAQMTGTIQISNTDKKEKPLTEVFVDLCERWNDNNFTFKPKEMAYTRDLKMKKGSMLKGMAGRITDMRRGMIERMPPTYHMWPGESDQSFLARANAEGKSGQVFHCAVHEHQILFQGQVKSKDSILRPGETKKWQFTIALPKQWVCDNPPENWRFEIEGKINGEIWVGPLEVPVEGSQVKPSFYFEPLAVAADVGVSAGKGSKVQKKVGAAPQPVIAQQQMGYVGSFTVIPKGQKATLQLAKGEEEGELIVTLQTPGTVRSAAEFKQIVDPSVLDGLMGKLDKVTAALNVLRSLAPDDPARLKVEKAHEALKKFGHALFLQVIPEHLHETIQNLTIALDFGLDESLVGYPWELMHDGTNFLCLKVPLGRYVASTSGDYSFKYIERGKRNGVKILLIVDPDGSLPGAKAEGEAIKASLDTIAGVDIKILTGEDATKAEVLMELAGGYDFLHYSGHAEFDPANPANSGLLLADGIIKASSLVSAVKAEPPILAFINACEAGRQADWSKGETQYENQVSGLASAFLLNGINFIGPYWPVWDDAALTFSINFYQAVLSGVPMGESVRRAKEFIFEKYHGEEIAWASYSFYGDPTQTLEFEKE